MTARMTPTRSGSPPGPASGAVRTAGAPAAPPHHRDPAVPGAPIAVEPAPGRPPGAELAPGPAAPIATPSDAAVDAAPRSAPGRADQRRAQRAARRARRRLALWCAVVVAFCLGVTILIVIMAGNRAPASLGAPAPDRSARAGAPPAPIVVADRGVPAPGGGGR